MIFDYGFEPVLIQRILFGFEAILDKKIPTIERSIRDLKSTFKKYVLLLIKCQRGTIFSVYSLLKSLIRFVNYASFYAPRDIGKGNEKVLILNFIEHFNFKYA